jgi:hypothetical protein
MLLHEFRLAEHSRLAATSLLDRRVAQLVYQAGVPQLDVPSQIGRAAILDVGRQLRMNGQPKDGISTLLAQLNEAKREAIHQETPFTSRLPLVATLRDAWNNVATRWYVRPNFDQQTRYNLALERAVTQLVEQHSVQAAVTALDSALLSWRIEQTSMTND